MSNIFYPARSRRARPSRREVIIGSTRPLPVQADGDPCGETPVTIKVLAGALRVIAVPGQTIAEEKPA